MERRTEKSGEGEEWKGRREADLGVGILGQALGTGPAVLRRGN